MWKNLPLVVLLLSHCAAQAAPSPHEEHSSLISASKTSSTLKLLNLPPLEALQAGLLPARENRAPSAAPALLADVTQRLDAALGAAGLAQGSVDSDPEKARPAASLAPWFYNAQLCWGIQGEPQLEEKVFLLLDTAGVQRDNLETAGREIRQIQEKALPALRPTLHDLMTLQSFLLERVYWMEGLFRAEVGKQMAVSPRSSYSFQAVQGAVDDLDRALILRKEPRVEWPGLGKAILKSDRASTGESTGAESIGRNGSGLDAGLKGRSEEGTHPLLEERPAWLPPEMPLQEMQEVRRRIFKIWDEARAAGSAARLAALSLPAILKQAEESAAPSNPEWAALHEFAWLK